MTNGTLGALFAKGRPADPDAVLLDVPGAAPTTYGDAARASARVAHALVALGVTAGDRVAVQVTKSRSFLLVYLGCLRAGAALLPVNPAATDAEVGHVVGDARPAVLLHDPDRTAPPGPVARTMDAAGRGTFADLADEQPDDFDDVPRRPDDLAAVLYTSGTTGRPKGAMLTQRNLASNAATLVDAWDFRPDDVLLHALPVFHTHGLFVATHCALASGSQMVFLPRFDADAVLAALPRCTVFMGVPTYYTRLLASPALDEQRTRRVRLFTCGSAPLLEATHEAFRERTGHAILERYGMTETTMLTSNPLDGPRRPGTVGPPLPGVDVRVVDDRGEAVTPGAVGGVEVRGPNVFDGYWGQARRPAELFTSDGFLRTGDLGCIESDGYLRLVGRSKDLIITGGLNVYPIEVETVLDALPGVQESAVVGVPDADLGERVVAVVTAEPGAVVDEEELRRAARTRLAGYKVPKVVHQVDALPRNAMGKVQKARLRATFGAPSPAG
ncbi:MAG TPA: AMP-binding protein [Acidimicrobiia bacterium]|nr:AMP-binding protein [Acidimicrobiia bacterium]